MSVPLKRLILSSAAPVVARLIVLFLKLSHLNVRGELMTVQITPLLRNLSSFSVPSGPFFVLRLNCRSGKDQTARWADNPVFNGILEKRGTQSELPIFNGPRPCVLKVLFLGNLVFCCPSVKITNFCVSQNWEI